MRALRRLALACALVAGCAPAPQPLAAGRLGRVRLLAPAGDVTRLVLLFADAPEGSAEVARAERGLAALGAAVLEVDLAEYLRGLAASDDGCHYVVAELEDVSKRAQRELGVGRYRSPILAGIGPGGTLAYAALAQAPAATLAGAVSVDPAPALRTRVPLCAGAPAAPAAGGGFAYGPRPALPGWWRVSLGDAADGDLRALVAAAGGRVVAEPAGAPAERLVATVAGALAETRRTASPVGDLPLVELPAARPHGLMAVIYSGDGGWRDLDKTIGEVLARHGVPVVGVDSLRYFWTARTPAGVAADLDAIIATYGARWRTPRVVLAGYSFGAGVLPFAVNRLPEATRARVALVALLGLEHRASFVFRFEGWLGGADATAPLVLPELQRLDLGRVQCFYGADEDDTLCPDPALAGAEIIRTAGGHHFDGDYPALARRILEGARRRARVDAPRTTR